MGYQGVVAQRGEATIKKPSAKVRKRLLTAAFVLLNVIVIAWTARSEFSGDNARIQDIEVRWALLLPSLLCLALAIAAGTAKLVLIMDRTTGRSSWTVALKTLLVGRYYDNITPAAVGGQPFQIYYLTKNGYSAAESAAIPLAAFVSMQLAFILMAIGMFIGCGNLILSDTIHVTAWIGLLFYTFFPVVILLSVIFPKAIAHATEWAFTLLHRLKLVKDKDAAVTKARGHIREYSECIRSLLRRPRLCVQILTLSLIYQVAMHLIPYFVLLAFGGELDLLSCFVTALAINSSISFIPTPGNAGAAEGSFYLVFSQLTSGSVFWAMLFWRFFNYYAWIILGWIAYGTMFLDKKPGADK
ncbi:MAG: flippase-like domain-containing protein [Clostridia bacterium]|nr:flippase-like domain-containing protein [Clostridia bacterium]